MRVDNGEAGSPATPGNPRVAIDAAVAGVLSLALYAATACRAVFSGDSAELTTAVSCFGIPHPPGYPLYTLLTGLWVHLLPGVGQALTSNLASAVHGALAVALSLVAFSRLGANRAGSVLGAMVLALGRSFWGQSVVAEVYALDVLLLALTAGALVRAWSASGSRPSWWAGITVGLWLGHRPINLVYLPALLIAARDVPGAGRGRLRPLPTLVGLAVAALPYLYLPLASARDPGLDIGNPEAWSRFRDVVTCSPYARHIAGGADLAWARVLALLRDLPFEVGVGALAAVLALWAVRRGRPAQRTVVGGLLLLLAANLVVASRYNVLDARVFFLPGIWAVAGLAALGVAALRSRTAVAALLVAGLVPGLLNLRVNDLREEDATARLAADLLASAPANAVLFAYGDTAAHALWYAQEVEQARRDVLVLSLGHFSDWYLEQLRERFPHDPWPDRQGLASPEACLPRLLEALGATRPVTFAMDPGGLQRFGPEAWWAARTMIPRGLLVEALAKRPAPDRQALADFDVRFWAERPVAEGMVRPSADLETSMVHLQYATAALRCGEFVARQGRGREAAAILERLLQLDPERIEREVERAFRGIGQERPPLGLADLARSAMTGLRPSHEVVAAGSASSRRPNVLWILWDTVRSDRMSLYGHSRSTTPFLEEWSRGARVFEDCLSIASTTVPAHASMLTGLLPRQHRADNVRVFLTEELETLPETLRRAGYQTCLYSENPLISAETGFGQGFDVAFHPWDETLRGRAAAILEGKIPARYRNPDLARLLREQGVSTWALSACGSLGEEAVLGWLGRRDPERPFFVFMNYMEAHAPVITPERWRERVMGPVEVARSYQMGVNRRSIWLHSFRLAPFSPADLEIIGRTYDAAVLELDDLLRSLLERLRAAGLLEHTVVVVVSDHGEHLGEHHLLDHQYSLYQELLRVPLILHFPEQVEPGRESRPVMNSDLYPTLLELAGLEPPALALPSLAPGAAPQALSLLAPLPERVRYASFPSVPTPPFDEVRQLHPEFDPTPYVRALDAVQLGGLKLIWSSDGRHELYDLAQDPGEARNLHGARPGEAAALTETLSAILSSPSPLATSPLPAVALTSEQREILRWLGYVDSAETTAGSRVR